MARPRPRAASGLLLKSYALAFLIVGGLWLLAKGLRRLPLAGQPAAGLLLFPDRRRADPAAAGPGAGGGLHRQRLLPRPHLPRRPGVGGQRPAVRRPPPHGADPPRHDRADRAPDPHRLSPTTATASSSRGAAEAPDAWQPWWPADSVDTLSSDLESLPIVARADGAPTLAATVREGSYGILAIFAGDLSRELSERSGIWVELFSGRRSAQPGDHQDHHIRAPRVPAGAAAPRFDPRGPQGVLPPRSRRARASSTGRR